MSQLIVQTEKLNFSYSKSKKDIDSLDLEVPKGSIYGFLGPNGSGKTTTIRLLLGLLNKNSGNVKVFEKPFANNRIDTLSKIGALIENPSLYNHLSARENLLIASNYRGNIKKDRIDEVLETVNLLRVKDKKVKTFSLGMKQRLGLAIALLSKPELLILDEPTNGLDPKGIIEMRELIKKLNKEDGITIFISSHLLSEIEKTCTHVGIIREGKMLFQDTVKALTASQSDQLQIELETDDKHRTYDQLIQMGFEIKSIEHEEHLLLVSVKEKSQIPVLVDSLRKNDINIYQVMIKNNLEELFLNLTEN
ncbi:ABC transporter ATP-binding protein [Aquimarina macrocephali]|uniref:ABC transporter ATP-binding protein n=1 Tax=Aquimarina macrocephali TaxID=666563 RepID=UPI000463939E|nr:ATP-binding cassette domain-containing protein [Aquimarina macrocephali]